jgi:hypothetical protein
MGCGSDWFTFMFAVATFDSGWWEPSVNVSAKTKVVRRATSDAEELLGDVP